MTNVTRFFQGFMSGLTGQQAKQATKKDTSESIPFQGDDETKFVMNTYLQTQKENMTGIGPDPDAGHHRHNYIV